MTRKPEWLAQKIRESRGAVHDAPCPKCGVTVLIGPSDETMH